ncbi:hypothetical protein VTK73DRAFT_9430 [Phialemonium thermophilum]|uniref:Uncharacterized protein n=1 Tax=Phialemonium thermophilum TaxID=223376 RepID=A0ABR3W296_9PEZI
MPSLWKSSSSAGRPKTGLQSTIRGRISSPIPIVDDEFPIRNPGTGLATTASDDEFPIRNPGSSIASTRPLPEGTVSQHLQELEQQQQQQQQQNAQLRPLPDSSTSTESLGGAGSRIGPTQNHGYEQLNQALSPGPPSGTSGSSSSPAVRGSPPRPSPPAPRTNPASTLRYSTVSEAPTGQTFQSKDGMPQRKKSTLRSALGKLFGRRKKVGSSRRSEGSSPGTSGRASEMLTAAQHRSDPSALSQVRTGETKRSASLPITEYDRALRSHSIGPEDMSAIESARNSLQAEAAGSPSRRRAATTTTTTTTTPATATPAMTTTTMMMMIKKNRQFAQRRGEFGEWTGLSPRPASSHARAARSASGLQYHAEDDPSEIGRAITRDSGGAGTAGRRRSRSLSGLHDAAGFGHGESRRRSDEIRYWRESYERGFLSPLSSEEHVEGEPRVVEVVEEVHSTGGDDDGDTTMGAAETSVPPSPSRAGSRGEDQVPMPETPLQPFNFGSLVSETAGMKITQAASLDGRVGDLETRVRRVEQLLEQVCRVVPGIRIPEPDPAAAAAAVVVVETPDSTAVQTPYPAGAADDPPGSSPPTTSSRQSVDADLQSHLSFGQAPAYSSWLHPPSTSTTQGTRSVTPTADPGLRPVSSATIRGAASLPTLGGGSSGIVDVASASEQARDDDSAEQLRRKLEDERAARRLLEAQVQKLSDRLNGLSTTMYAMVRDPARSRSRSREEGQFLQPSPRSPLLQPQTKPKQQQHHQLHHHRQQQQQQLPKASSNTLASGDTPPTSAPLHTPQTATLSVFETDDESEAEMARRAAAAAEEAQRTKRPSEKKSPQRSGAYGYGAFGEELLEDEEAGEGDGDSPKRKSKKKAARTLSLSQLTLSREARVRI